MMNKYCIGGGSPPNNGPAASGGIPAFHIRAYTMPTNWMYVAPSGTSAAFTDFGSNPTTVTYGGRSFLGPAGMVFPSYGPYYGGGTPQVSLTFGGTDISIAMWVNVNTMTVRLL